MGYDLANCQMTSLDYDAYVTKGGQLPDVVLVRKSYVDKRRRYKAKVGGQVAERTCGCVSHQGGRWAGTLGT